MSWNPVRMVETSRATRLVDNFGDLLGPLLVERIAGATAMRRTQPPSVSAPSTVVAVGSILHLAPPRSVVWGAGVNFKLASKLPRWADSLDLRAVRGPYSARALAAAGIPAPDVFGDPALLLPRYMPELVSWQAVGSGNPLVVPNFNDYKSMSAAATARGLAAIDPRDSLARVLRSIAGSGFVIGSSLHAVIIADSLGIPARFVSSSAEGPLKYRDYLAGTGRPFERIAPDLEAAIDLGGHTPLESDVDRLLTAFPYDLWTSTRAPQSPEFMERPSIIAAWKEILTEEKPSMERHATAFIEEIMPSLIEAGKRAIACTETARARGADDSLASSFADAYAYRKALAGAVYETDLPIALRPHLAAVDSGDLSQLLRSIWLHREGPHALMRSLRSSVGRHVMSIAVRPGSLTNEVEGIDLVVTAQSGRVHSLPVPVFAMYRRQWSIDVCGSIDMPARDSIASIDVRISGPGGRAEILPVVELEQQFLSLRGYPPIAGAPRWTETARQERNA